MYALLSELDKRSITIIKDVLKGIDDETGVVAVTPRFEKHLSWQGMKDINIDRARTIVERISRGQKPLNLHADFLGVFPGNPVVLFIGVAKNKSLFQLHDSLWKGLTSCSIEPNEHYAPDLWIPHITLYHGTSEEDPLPINYLKKLIHIPLELDFVLSSIKLVYFDSRRTEDIFEFVFK